MRVMSNNKTFFESFQENLNESEKLLEPQYDTRKSFYGKAKVSDENGVKTLTSYDTEIMKISDGKITMLCDADALTQTTLRHIREFLQQNGLEPLSKGELVKLINGEELKEEDESYSDLDDREIVNDVIENYKEITGKDLKSIFNYNEDEYEGGYFKQDVVESTAQAIVDYLEGKGLSRSRVDDLLYVLDDKLSELWNNYRPDDLNESFDLDDALADVTEVAESVYKGSEINSDTISSLLNSHESLKDKYSENQKEKIVKWFEDEEKRLIPIEEQDETVKVVTANQKERNYSITDITELSNVNDGDVQAPIDIAGLLVEVDERLTESVGEDWGQINFQSTRFNADTKDSNALFELCVGDKTYLMSMLLEENCSLLKVNNTKGKTIFKRKTNDVAGIAESYIRQFIPVNESAKEEKEDLFGKILSENTSLSDRLLLINLSVEGFKSVGKEDKESAKSFIQHEMYSFVTELGAEVKNNVPNDDDTTELPTFDKMVEDLFGKEWVKEEKEPEAKEVSGSETLKEDFEQDPKGPLICPKCGSGKYDEVVDSEFKDEETKRDGQEVHFKCPDCGYESHKVTIYESAQYYYKEFSSSGEIDYIEFETEQEAEEYAEKVNKETGHETAVYKLENNDCVALFDAKEDLNKESNLKEANDSNKNKFINFCKGKIKDLGTVEIHTKKIIEDFDPEDDEDEVIKVHFSLELPNGTKYVDSEDVGDYVYEDTVAVKGERVFIVPEWEGGELNDSAELNFKYIDKKFYKKLIDNWESWDMEDRFDNNLEESNLKEVEDPIKEDISDDLEQPKQGLGTGNAEFFRKPKNINDLNDKSGKGFTDGDSSYLIVSKETLSKDEFDRLQDDFGSINEYCKSFEPIDSDGYAFNVIEFSCSDYDYKLLVDPSGYDYCRYVAKVGGSDNEVE